MRYSEMNGSKEEKKNSKTNGIKKQEKLIDVPELCQFCKYKTKVKNPDSDRNFDYCGFLGGVFKPTILCFTPKDNKEYTQLKKVVVVFTHKLEKLNFDIEESFYEDVRNIVDYICKITRLIKDLQEQFNQSIYDFTHFLDKNKLNRDEKYLYPVK